MKNNSSKSGLLQLSSYLYIYKQFIMNIIITEKQYENIKYKILIDAIEELFKDIED